MSHPLIKRNAKRKYWIFPHRNGSRCMPIEQIANLSRSSARQSTHAIFCSNANRFSQLDTDREFDPREIAARCKVRGFPLCEHLCNQSGEATIERIKPQSVCIFVLLQRPLSFRRSARSKLRPAIRFNLIVHNSYGTNRSSVRYTVYVILRI